MHNILAGESLESAVMLCLSPRREGTQVECTAAERPDGQLLVDTQNSSFQVGTVGIIGGGTSLLKSTYTFIDT